MGDGGDDPGAVFLDPVVELDERGDLAPAGPGEPRVEHGDGFGSSVGEHEQELFLSVNRP